MAAVTTAIEHFSESELGCRCCGTVKLHPTFAEKLPELRKAWGGPLVPSSVCRCPKRNTLVGGHPRSLHLTANPVHLKAEGTMAADLRWASWEPEQRLAFARLAWANGWSIGLHPSYIHIDRRADIDLPKAIYYYAEWPMDFRKQDVTA